MTAFIRQSSLELHPFLVMFWRSLFGLLFMLPWVLGAGLGALKTRRWRLYLLRGTLGIGSMMCWFTAVATIPIAEATALFFTSSLFGTVLAALVLHEVVGVRRWVATIVGFLGVVIIIRPGFQVLAPAAFLALGAAAAVGASLSMVKILSRTESSAAIITYMVLVLTPLSLIPALLVWEWPTLETLGWLVALAAAATTGHLGMTRAFRLTDASAVIPLAYTQLPITALIGFVAFAEVPDEFTWIGGAVIVASSVYIGHREALRTRKPVAVPAQPQGPSTR